MEELGGSLESIRLIDVVRFLASLGKSGSLRISNDTWKCQISIVSGSIQGAAFQSDRGLDAIEAAMLLLKSGRFAFGGTIRPMSGTSRSQPRTC